MSNRQSSTLAAWAENSAKLTPTPSQVAPSGNEWPSRTRGGVLIWNGRTTDFPRGAFMPLPVGQLLVDQPSFVRQGLAHLAHRGSEIALAAGARRLHQQRARERPAPQAAEPGPPPAGRHGEPLLPRATAPPPT